MIDDLIPDIERVQSDGAVVLLKWDGLRPKLKCTVVITREETDYIFRRDSDDLARSLHEALIDYHDKHPA